MKTQFRYTWVTLISLCFILSIAYSKRFAGNKKQAGISTQPPAKKVALQQFSTLHIASGTKTGKQHQYLTSDDNFDLFVSNNGSDTNNGKSALHPKLHISNITNLTNLNAASAAGTSFGLEANSTFREQFNPVQNDITVGIYNYSPGKQLAKITGMDVVTDWIVSRGTMHVYEYSLTHSINIFTQGYAYVMVAEIDTLLEKTNPIKAVKYLTLVNSVGKCDSLASTYYAQGVTTNPLTVYIHCTDGVPGKNKYRYEVTTRDFGINGFYVDGGKYQNLYLQSASNGYGMLSAGNNTLARKIVFQGGGIHHSVIKSGLVDSCLFLPGPQGINGNIALVFYKDEGTGDINRISNTVFVDIPSALYTHTNGVKNHQSLTIDNVYAFADSSYAATAFGASNTDSIVITNSYVENYPACWFGTSAKFLVKNSIFKNSYQSAIFVYPPGAVNENSFSNILIKTNGNDNNQAAVDDKYAFGIRAPYATSNVEVSNLIFHGYSSWHQPYETLKVFDVGGKLQAHNNVYICDVNSSNSLHVSNANNSSGIGSSTNVLSDYNVFVLLRGAGLHWNVYPNNNGEGSVTSLLQWQQYTGQDKHSIIIDLRNNPLALKAIYVDPDNGNWTLTTSSQADSIRKMSAGMTTPPLFYPERPLITDATTPFKLPGGFSTFTGAVDTNYKSVLSWRTFNESDYTSFAVEYSTDSSNYKNIATIPAAQDSSNHTYTFVDSQQLFKVNYYRIKRTYIDSTFKYSAVVKLLMQPKKDNTSSVQENITAYPNPNRQTLMLKHPARDQSQISVYDVSGKQVKLVHVQPGSLQSVITLNDLRDGVYIIRWTSNHEQLTTKIIKQD